MNIWIVTIGSSDVQLDSDKIISTKGRNEKQRSNKVWSYWYEDVKPDCYDITFEPKQAYKDSDESYRIEPRVLGMVYESSTPEIRDEIWSYLTFPLLDNFVGKLKSNNSPPDAIAVLLTNQSKIFKDDHIRRKPKCPYWQDTCTLKLILERYFQDRFSNIKTESIEWLSLAPNSEKGIDNWDNVLDLVDEKLRNLQINAEVVKKENVETVYVSHQAGTPAISSAVQFSSLAQFKKVQFLVSNEYNSNLTEFVPDSKYLQKLQQEKAKQLLNRHDYSGVKELLSSYLTPEIKDLLDAAIQWNFAKFDDFAQAMIKAANKYKQDNEWWQTIDSVVEARSKEWWWTAYESAYLAVVRLKQGNTVEAMFHSFRAVEGLLRKWADKYKNIEKQGKKFTKQGKKFKLSSTIPAPWDNKKTTDELNSYGQGLYWTLDFFQGVDKNKDTELDIWTFGNYVFDLRNSLFHNLEGLKDKKAVFKAWKISSDDEQEKEDEIEQKQKDDEMEQKWKDRILGCLNFISGQSFTPPLETASLMHQIHEKLVNAIALYQPTP
jgi:hypothetical protein